MGTAYAELTYLMNWINTNFERRGDLELALILVKSLLEYDVNDSRDVSGLLSIQKKLDDIRAE